MTAKTVPVDTFDLVIFGGTGDLALRKLLPGLFRRFADGQIPTDSRIIGVARDTLSDDDYRAKVSDALAAARDGDPRTAWPLHRPLEELRHMRSATPAGP